MNFLSFPKNSDANVIRNWRYIHIRRENEVAEWSRVGRHQQQWFLTDYTKYHGITIIKKNNYIVLYFFDVYNILVFSGFYTEKGY